MSEFEIRYTILQDDKEIGFGAAFGDTIDAAAHAIGTDIERRQWETAPGMPDPAEAS